MELQYLTNNFQRVNGKYVCPYNAECRCEKLRCGECGWNPKVAEKRSKAIRRELGCDEEDN